MLDLYTTNPASILTNKMIMIKTWLCFLLLASTGAQIGFCSDHQAYVKEQLQRISPQDRELLSLYFETLLTNDFAYTLFGDKPVSSTNFMTTDIGRSMKNALLRGGKLAWDRHSHLFTSDNFIFLFQSRDKFQDIILINIPAFKNMVSTHIADFQKVLGADITPETLLARLCKNGALYEDVLHGHEGLIGLLYGFGRTNAFLCYNLYELQRKADKYLQVPFSIPHKTDEELEKIRQDPYDYFRYEGFEEAPAELQAIFTQYDALSKTMQSFPDDEDALSLSTLCLFTLPSCGAILDHPETIALKQNYTKTRLNIINAYSQGDFLEVTLCKLIEK